MTSQPDMADRRQDLLDTIRDTARDAGRDPSDITLVAVSKRQSEARLDAALAAGQRVFGENRVQEAQSHWESRRADHPDLELRLIGPLQTNKAADAVALFDVIETLDRDKLARALRKAMDESGRTPRLYVQVNTGDEPQKAGIAPADLPDFLASIRSDYGFEIEGLMCIPPVEEPAGLHFALLAKLARENDVPRLSMGMSADFETAIRLGATSVRVGTGFFGPRED
ncbi:YggS family pyridoxal phosphate-dependent enzyme [Maricaulis parjimensis]|uniref:YggS family pyridoxal phosphate-dependent enzyme n=1 Tax=Maricaulis parjimensis TaxID=144023 RepID=UPI001939FA1D|nr:YggS family pyridoxal phosphate-dependent enzyme [Maricaulis parjimensis]